MQRKKDPTDSTQPEHPTGSVMPDDFDDMKPERIGIEIVLPDGTKITIENALALAIRPL